MNNLKKYAIQQRLNRKRIYLTPLIDCILEIDNEMSLDCEEQDITETSSMFDFKIDEKEYCIFTRKETSTLTVGKNENAAIYKLESGIIKVMDGLMYVHTKQPLIYKSELPLA